MAYWPFLTVSLSANSTGWINLVCWNLTKAISTFGSEPIISASISTSSSPKYAYALYWYELLEPVITCLFVTT